MQNESCPKCYSFCSLWWEGGCNLFVSLFIKPRVLSCDFAEFLDFQLGVWESSCLLKWGIWMPLGIL